MALRDRKTQEWGCHERKNRDTMRFPQRSNEPAHASSLEISHGPDSQSATLGSPGLLPQTPPHPPPPWLTFLCVVPQKGGRRYEGLSFIGVPLMAPYGQQPVVAPEPERKSSCAFGLQPWPVPTDRRGRSYRLTPICRRPYKGG